VAIITTPDNNTSSKGSQGSPSVGHFAYFDRPGTWYLWLRGWGDTINGEGSSDSVHAGLNGSLSDTADQIDNFPPGWTWSNHTRDNTRAKLNIPSKGIHAVNLWMREDGLTIDKILLTTDSSYTPSGAGPSVEAESLPVNPQTTNNNSSANTVTVANTVDSGEAPSNDSTHVTAVFDNTPVSTEVTVNTQSGNNSNGIENENPANTNSVATAPTAQGDNSGIVATNNTNTDATDNSNRNDDTNSFTAPTTQDNNSGGGALDLLLLITMLGGLIVRMMAGKR